MPIIPNNPGVGVYMHALATVTELVFKLAGGYGSREQNISGEDNISIIDQITKDMDKLLKENMYDVFYSQFKGVLNGLNIRFKEYKGTPDEKEWLNNIVEDSADLLGLIKQQYETEVQNNHEHTTITLGIYADVCLFRAIAMSERKHTYQMDRDKDVKDMLEECKNELSSMIVKVQRISENKKIIADNCVDPPPAPGTIALPICFIVKDEAKKVEDIVTKLTKQKESIETAISVIPA